MTTFIGTISWFLGKLSRLIVYAYCFLVVASYLAVHSKIAASTGAPERFAFSIFLAIFEAIVLILIPIAFFSFQPVVATYSHWAIFGVLAAIFAFLYPDVLELAISYIHF